MSQSSAVSARDLLPDNCLLNLENDDDDTVNLVTDVDDMFYKTLSSQSFDEEPNNESANHIDFELREEDVKLDDETSSFLKNGCGCKYADGGLNYY